VQLIKPLSKENELPAKRGRKSLKENNLDVALLDIPDDETLARKQYYSISEVAEWFNMKPSLLRFWENEFDILKPRKNRKGDRLFRPEDIKNLRIIYYLLRQQKYSIEGAKQYLKDNKKKAEVQVQLVESLTKFRSFLLELRANLGA
jgi:DNA-binding transcriptional MerR regulator